MTDNYQEMNRDTADLTAETIASLMYTSGELAKECATTVRTVQYYDQKGLLAPSGYSEGGRRLFGESDADRLRFILLLKQLGLKLTQIKGVLESPNREAILESILAERELQLQDEIAERETALSVIELMVSELRTSGRIIATTPAAMESKMNDNRARTRWWVTMIVVGVLMDVAWISTLVYGIVSGMWWPFPLALVFVVAAGIWMVVRYGDHATFLCPACHAEFRPKTGAFFFSCHTPTTRKLACPCCHRKDWCVERYHANPLEVAPGACVPGTCHCCEDTAPSATGTDGPVAKGGDRR